MDSDNNAVRTIPWREWFPWTLIFRSLPVAVSIPVMILALVGVIITPAGWWVSQLAFVNTEKMSAEDPAFAEFMERSRSPYKGILSDAPGESLGSLFGVRINGPKLVFVRLAEPFWRMFRQYNGVMPFLYLLVGGAWTIAVWSLIGMAIVRIAVMRYARNEAVELDDALRFAWSRFPSCALGLTIPLAGVLGLCLFTFVAGLLMTFDAGLFIVSLFYFVVIAIAGVMAIILLGLAFGWPLTIAAMSAEGQDSFDAMTRSYAYTFQRPVNYVFYALVAILFGGLCWILVARVTEGTENLSYWSTSWGANVRAERIQSIRDPDGEQQSASAVASNADKSPADGETTAPTHSRMFEWSRNVIGFWLSLLKSVAVAFLYAHFWCMVGAVYLLLRRDVDETEIDEVFVAEEQRTYELPPLSTEQTTSSAESSRSTSSGEAETQARPNSDA